MFTAKTQRRKEHKFNYIILASWRLGGEVVKITVIPDQSGKKRKASGTADLMLQKLSLYVKKLI
jgi:hypothetical protein